MVASSEIDVSNQPSLNSFFKPVKKSEKHKPDDDIDNNTSLRNAAPNDATNKNNDSNENDSIEEGSKGDSNNVSQEVDAIVNSGSTMEHLACMGSSYASFDVINYPAGFDMH